MSSHNKPIVYTPEYSDFSQNRPQLDKREFEESIDSHGQKITIEKATKCPCVGKDSGQPKINCINCGGFGWFFYNKRESRAVIQKVNRGNKYMSWNEMDYGRASLSFRPDEKLAYMDRVVNLTVLSEFSQILRLEEVSSGIYRAQTTYPIDAIKSAFLFASENAKLRVIEPQDVTFSYNSIEIVDNPILIGCATPYTLSVRYSHNPVYHILEVTRENQITKFNSKSLSETETSFGQDFDLPVHAIAVKANIIFDKKTIYDKVTEDNTNISFSI